MTRIYLERHGQSIGNAGGIYIGHTDLGLTEEGIMQSEITASHLSDEPISAVYSSDLIRAKSTAEPHARIRGLKVKVSKMLREVYVGDWEGRDASELRKLEDFTVNRTHRDFVYPNGEDTRRAADRLHREIKRIAALHQNETILIVSHSAVIRAFWYYLCGYTELNMTDRVPFMLNASYCILDYNGEELIPVRYGIADHLPASKVRPI